MTISERILNFVRQYPGRDDDEISRVLKIQPRQTVNQACRALVQMGKLERKPGPSGKLVNHARVSERRSPPASPVTKPIAPQPQQEVAKEWFWEGNIVDVLATHLISEGWVITARADTLSRERGVDLKASRAGRRLLVEVKGYPSTSYRNPALSHLPKPTNPRTQAQQWFSHALLKAARLRSADQDAIVAIAFPAMARYNDLVNEVAIALSRLDVAVFLIEESGRVSTVGLE